MEKTKDISSKSSPSATTSTSSTSIMQSEMIMFLSALNIFSNTTNHSLMTEFFRDFLPILEQMPPESLSLVWGKNESIHCINNNT